MVDEKQKMTLHAVMALKIDILASFDLFWCVFWIIFYQQFFFAQNQMYQGLNPLYWGWSLPLNRESL